MAYSVTCAVIYSITLMRRRDGDYSELWLTVFIVAGTFVVLIIVTVSLIEGLHGNWKVSFIFGLIVSLAFSFVAFIRTVNLDNIPEQELELWFGLSINLNELQASCYRVLSLFLWKQTLMAAYTRGEWCICIYLSPHIKWIDQ